MQSSGSFSNGLKILDSRIYWTDFTKINVAPILPADDPGTTRTLVDQTTFFDDIYVAARGILAADYSLGDRGFEVVRLALIAQPCCAQYGQHGGFMQGLEAPKLDHRRARRRLRIGRSLVHARSGQSQRTVRLLAACERRCWQRAAHDRRRHRALAEHATRNYRTLTMMAHELLLAAAERDARQRDDKLFFEIFALPDQQPRTAHQAPVHNRAKRR